MSEPPFAAIGPFDFRRSDQIVAAIYIGLVIGRGFGKIFCYAILVVSLAVFVFGGIVKGIVIDLLVGVGLPLLIFIILPALRSNRRNRDIMISYDPEGLQVKTAQVRTVYHWDSIGPAHFFASRLFVMIERDYGLIIPVRATSAANLRELGRLIDTR